MANLNPVDLFIPELKMLLNEKKFDDVKAMLSEINPIDFAEGLTQFSPEQQILLCRLLKPAQLIAVFEELDIPHQEFILQRLDDQHIEPLLEGIPVDVTAKLFHKLPEKAVKKMSALMKKERVETVKSVLEYAPNTVGSLMEKDFIPIGVDMTARATLDRLHINLRFRDDKSIHSLYAVSPAGKLVGAVPLQALISAPPDIRIKDIMMPVGLIKIQAKLDQEDAAKTFARYKLISAPVVDEENRLIGVLNADDVIKVITQEDTEDIQKLAGVEAFDEPYFKIAFHNMIKKRGAWLCVLFVGEMLTATAMGFFESQISKAVVLALFIPLIISSGGNSGSQAATLIVRALALKEVTLSDWWRVTRREFASGLALGSILGTIGFLRIFLWAQFSDIYGPHYMLVASTVALSLLLVVMWGTLSGSILPIILRRLGLDPAVVSAPFVATLVDVTGLVIYFTTAMIIMKGVLL